MLEARYSLVFRPLLVVLASDYMPELVNLVTLAAFGTIVILTLRTDSNFSRVHAHLTPSYRPTCASSDHFSGRTRCPLVYR